MLELVVFVVLLVDGDVLKDAHVVVVSADLGQRLTAHLVVIVHVESLDLLDRGEKLIFKGLRQLRDLHMMVFLLCLRPS